VIGSGFDPSASVANDREDEENARSFLDACLNGGALRHLYLGIIEAITKILGRKELGIAGLSVAVGRLSFIFLGL
jgi:hypothetical protein